MRRSGAMEERMAQESINVCDLEDAWKHAYARALGAEDRPAMVVGWIEDPAKILTEVFRQLSEQDALSRILAIYNRELHSAASMEADIEEAYNYADNTCPQHAAIGSIGVPRDQARLAPEVRHENVAAPSTPGIGYPKGESRWQAVTMAVHAVKMAAVCAVVWAGVEGAIYLHRVAP